LGGSKIGYKQNPKIKIIFKNGRKICFANPTHPHNPTPLDQKRLNPTPKLFFIPNPTPFYENNDKPYTRLEDTTKPYTKVNK